MSTTDTTAHLAALAYAAAGVPVFPCGPDKRPLTPNGFKAASTNAATIAAWWTTHPRALIGRPTGAISGVVVLDVDIDGGTSKAGDDALNAGAPYRLAIRRHVTTTP